MKVLGSLIWGFNFCIIAFKLNWHRCKDRAEKMTLTIFMGTLLIILATSLITKMSLWTPLATMSGYLIVLSACNIHVETSSSCDSLQEIAEKVRNTYGDPEKNASCIDKTVSIDKSQKM
jgi:predicted membrane channel-forming protein YqfA (hemolysin III family)